MQLKNAGKLSVTTCSSHIVVTGDEAANSDLQLKRIPNYHFVLRVVIDILFQFLLYQRQYDGETRYNRLTQHYYQFCMVPSCFNACVQRERQNWCYPNRVFTSLQIIHTNFALMSINMGDGSLSLELSRITVGFVRMIDAIQVWYSYGPYVWHLPGLQDKIKRFHQPYSHATLAPLKYIAFVFLAYFLPYFIAHWHQDYGFTQMWGPISGAQAGNAVTVQLNVYLMSIVMVCPKRRLLATVIVCVGTIMQYVLCFELFTNAAVPYVHFVDLLLFGHGLCCLIYLLWRDKRTAKQLHENVSLLQTF